MHSVVSSRRCGPFSNRPRAVNGAFPHSGTTLQSRSTSHHPLLRRFRRHHSPRHAARRLAFPAETISFPPRIGPVVGWVPSPGAIGLSGSACGELAPPSEDKCPRARPQSPVMNGRPSGSPHQPAGNAARRSRPDRAPDPSSRPRRMCLQGCDHGPLPRWCGTGLNPSPPTRGRQRCRRQEEPRPYWPTAVVTELWTKSIS